MPRIQPWIALVLVAALVPAARGVLDRTISAASLGQTASVQIQAGRGRAAAAPAGPATGLILGAVFDGMTKRPVPGVVVTLGGGVPMTVTPAGVAGGRGSVQPNRLLTDGEGRFLFRNLVAGTYSLSATKPGYLPGSYGRSSPTTLAKSIRLETDGRLGPIDIRMWRLGSISGSVADEASEPAIGIRVTLLRETFRFGARQFVPAGNVATDDRGFYRFGSLQPGTYTVMVPSTTMSSPQTSVDRFQQPMSNEERQALNRTIQESGAGIIPMQMPGVSYRGSVLHSLDGQTSSNPDLPRGDERLMVYTQIYYPAERVIAHATPIAVGAGQDLTGMHVQRRVTTSFSVSGVLLGPDGPAPNIGLRLTASEGPDMPGAGVSGLEVSATVSDPSGRFTFNGVPEGQYLIRAYRVPRPAPAPPPPPPPPPPGSARGIPMTSLTTAGSAARPPVEPTVAATHPVSVGTEDVQDVAVQLIAGGRISGRVDFEGGITRPAPEQVQRLTVTLQALSAEGQIGGQPGRVSPDGRFELPSYPPGRYLATANTPPGGWALKSIQVNGRDALDTPFDLSSSDIGGVVVTYTDQTTEVAGTVSVGLVPTDDVAAAVIFPADYRRWVSEGMSPHRMRTAVIEEDGTFSARGLPPGEYLVAAGRGAVFFGAGDPALVEQMARGASRISLQYGATANVRLTEIRELR